MVSQSLIYDLKLSSVVPSKITGEDKNHELTDMDLAMKLHYVTTLHFFEGKAVEGMNIHDFKKPMFEWLDWYYPICGRLRRRDEDGRPFVKCNDSGVRIVEAKCVKTLEEWLLDYATYGENNDLLVYNQQMSANDLGFTPLVFLQLTEFKCGGLCMGMSWAHTIGDAFTALNCINTYGKIMNNNDNQLTTPNNLINNPITNKSLTTTVSNHCKCIKQLPDPLGDNWIIPNHRKMQSRTFHIKESNLRSKHVLPRQEDVNEVMKPFELICGIIWKSLAKIRRCGSNSSEPTIVTVCKKKFDTAENKLLGNSHMVIGTVEAKIKTSVADSDPLELANLIDERFVDDTDMVEKSMQEQSGKGDYVVYGANFTFVNLEEADLYGLNVRKHKPVYAELSIRGIGDEGCLLVLPLGDKDDSGRIINVILPEDELQELGNELKMEWGIL